MVEALKKNGLYFDDLKKLRILEPVVSQLSIELKDDCKEFIYQVAEFQKKANKFIEILEELAEEVDNERMKGLGGRNLLKSLNKKKDGKKQQLIALITEKRIELERLQIQYKSLKRVEAEQNEFIEQLLLQK